MQSAAQGPGAPAPLARGVPRYQARRSAMPCARPTPASVVVMCFSASSSASLRQVQIQGFCASSGNLSATLF